jgi:hypothetical protein
MLNALRKRARPLARIGCVAIGTVYLLVGGVALIALTGHLIEYADQDRLPLLLRRLPGGLALIWAIAIGTAAYVCWRVIEALTDPYDLGRDWLGILKRTAVGLSGLAYGLLSYSAARAAMHVPGGGRDASEQQQQLLVSRVLHWPGGAWIVGAAGLAVVAVGLVQFWLVLKRSYTTEIRMAPRSSWGATMLHVLAGYGYSARGVILCVLGYFFVRAGVTFDPSAVGDTDTAFDFIGGGAVGNTAFAIVAIGTMAYGLFMYANAWLYRFQATPGRPGGGGPAPAAHPAQR